MGRSQSQPTPFSGHREQGSSSILEGPSALNEREGPSSSLAPRCWLSPCEVQPHQKSPSPRFTVGRVQPLPSQGTMPLKDQLG